MIDIKAFTKRILKSVKEGKKPFDILNKDFEGVPHRIYVIKVLKKDMSESFFEEMAPTYVSRDLNSPFMLITKQEDRVIIALFKRLEDKDE